MSGLVDRITEVLKEHQWWFVGCLGVPGMMDQRGYKCACGWETRATKDEPAADPHAHVAAAVQNALEIWLPPLFASAIQAYTDSESTGLAGYGDDPTAAEVLQRLNNEAASIAAYAFTSSKWREQP